MQLAYIPTLVAWRHLEVVFITFENCENMAPPHTIAEEGWKSCFQPTSDENMAISSKRRNTSTKLSSPELRKAWLQLPSHVFKLGIEFSWIWALFWSLSQCSETKFVDIQEGRHQSFRSHCSSHDSTQYSQLWQRKWERDFTKKSKFPTWIFEVWHFWVDLIFQFLSNRRVEKTWFFGAFSLHSWEYLNHG